MFFVNGIHVLNRLSRNSAWKMFRLQRISNQKNTENQLESIAVLVVEDNPDDAILISEFLTEESGCEFSIKVVTTLADAIQVMGENDFDVVLLDLTLPDSTGLDTVRKIVGRFSDAVVIVLTGLSDAQIAVQSVRYGAQDYLEKKDISSMWLGRAIRHAMERKRIMSRQEELFSDLTAALNEIEMLQKVVPICANCKKIRNDRDEWGTMEDFLCKQTKSAFGPDICPECITILYPVMKINKSK